MSSTLDLALRLGAYGDDELVRAVSARRFDPAKVDDLFDLAEALLDATSVQSALAALDRDALAVLAVVADGANTPHAIGGRLQQLDAREIPAVPEILGGLVDSLLLEVHDDSYDAYAAVRERLSQWPSESLPSTQELAATTAPAALAAVPDADIRFTEAVSAEHAFAAVGTVAELVAEIARDPARELQKGGIALPDMHRLAAATGVTDNRVAVVMWCSEHAGLIARDAAAWLVTAQASQWLPQATHERWAALATSWVHTMPQDVRTLLHGRARTRWDDGLRAFARWRYPADTSSITRRLDTFLEVAEFLGITVDGGPTPAGVALLAGDGDAAAGVVAKRLPPEVDKVYLQHDLSIVSPGPLAPALDARLRTMADVESRGIAATYRVSAASITRAIAAGETQAGILGFLERISMTGIPQPLGYLIGETASRYGRVRVSTVEEGGATSDRRARSRIRSHDEELIEAIAIDQALGTLGLVRDGAGTLVSRFERDVVFWALTDARYPVAAEDADGVIITLSRGRTARRGRGGHDDRIGAMLERLRDAARPDAAATREAWLSRQLEDAIRRRSILTVTVALPDGRELEFVLEPTGVAGGRLRGRDRAADIERTVPLSSIRGIRAH